jgi:hypothetical protein
MNLAPLALALAVVAAPATAQVPEPSAAAQPNPLKLRSKAAVAEVLSPRTSSAPFREPVSGPELELLPPAADPRAESKAWSCDGERSLCYDPTSRRIVYKPARALMPEIPGLQRENISVKRDRITFKYSF